MDNCDITKDLSIDQIVGLEEEANEINEALDNIIDRCNKSLND